ncbi:MAG TPA: cysteine rich repeat-containing protein [Polyangia bacterium]
MKRIMMLVVASAMGLAGTAFAQDKPCMADAARLCADVEPGGGAQIACLKAHKAELSPACKKNVMKMKVKQMEQQQLEQQQQQPPPPATP